VYAFAFLDDFIALYPVYALLFADSGLSVGQISTLFLLWSVTAFGLEVPSGALADRVSRRTLLAVAAGLRAAGYALWVLFPAYPAFAAGFVLWGIKSAMTSGTWDALVYDELAAVGSQDRYPRLVGRSEVLSTLGVVAGTAAAAPLVTLGGFALAGWASVAVCLACAAVALALPERPRARAVDDEGGLAGYLGTLRAGLAEARSDRVVRRLLVVAALLGGITAIDEYLALLARSTGASSTLVPVLMVAPYAGLVVGAELAGRMPRARPGTIAAMTAAGAVLLAAGALVGHPAGFVAIGGFYAATWFGMLISGVRLQDAMSGTARATVTSVGGVGDELVALAVYGACGLGSAWFPVGVLVAAPAVPILLLAVVLPRWLPRARPSGGAEPAAAPATQPAAGPAAMAAPTVSP
jgi:MFS family permease